MFKGSLIINQSELTIILKRGLPYAKVGWNIVNLGCLYSQLVFTLRWSRG